MTALANKRQFSRYYYRPRPEEPYDIRRIDMARVPGLNHSDQFYFALKQHLKSSQNTWAKARTDCPQQVPGVAYLDEYVSTEYGANEIELAKCVRNRMRMPGRNYDFVSQGKLTDEQFNLARLATTCNISYITGPPGSGKTTMMKAIADAMAIHDYNLIIVAPTGRGAKQISDYTNYPATTIHRALGANPRFGFKHNKFNKLECDFVICDESSMDSVSIALALFEAIPEGTPILFVGDADQLDSVEPGKFYRDLIACGMINGGALTKLFRFAEDSHIFEAASSIRSGVLPQGSPRGQLGFHYTRMFDDGTVMRPDYIPKVVGSAANLLETDDLRVISPVYDGDWGVNYLNGLMKEHFNPNDEFPTPVICTENQNRIKIYNGDVGYMSVISGSRMVFFEGCNLPTKHVLFNDDWMQLGYAQTTYKTQGTQFIGGFTVIPPGVRNLSRREVYTAVTRCQKFSVVTGSFTKFREAITRPEVERVTLLQSLLAADDLPQNLYQGERT